MNRKTYLSLGASLLASAIAAPVTAHAQTAEDAGEIVVTGTAIRGVAPVGSATVSVSREAMLESGIRDAGNLTTILPQGTNNGSLQNSGGRGSGINLRGLGTQATLILFDGHRPITTGTQTVVADPNQIPFGALERTEVVTDGASAVYGADAVAGVVNYIFRRPFDGAEVTGRYTHTLYEQAGVDAVFGKTWSNGGLMIAGSYEANTGVTQGSVPWLRRDLRPFGGNDNRATGSGTTISAVTSPGLVPVLLAAGTAAQGGGLYGLRNGATGVTPTAAQLELIPLGRSDLYDKYGLVDQSDLQDFYTERRRGSVMVKLDQDIGPGQLTATAMYNRRDNIARGAGDGSFQQIGISLGAANATGVINPVTFLPSTAGSPYNSPYRVAGVNGNLAQTLFYNYRMNNPNRPLNREDYENATNLFLDYKMPLVRDFQLTLSGSWGITDGCPVCQPQFNTILTGGNAADIYDGMFNPYITGPQPSGDAVFGIFLQNGQQRQMLFTPKIDGPLFELPAGAVRIAFGGEFARYNYHQTAYASLNVQGIGSQTQGNSAEIKARPTTTYEVFRSNDVHREVKSGYAEVFVPFFSDSNALPLLQQLDLSLAARYDDYSDFGATTNPKVGFTWVPVNDLKVRGSWGTSFRAPTLSDTAFNAAGAGNRTNYTNNMPELGLVRTGTNSLVLVSSFKFKQLTAENAETMSFGTDYTPSFIPGLKLGATYYAVEYKDRISGVPNQVNTIFQNQANYDLYKDFFIPAPQPAGCQYAGNQNPGSPQYATYNPIYLQYLNAPGSYPPNTAVNDCNLVGVILTNTQNLGKVTQRGIDYSASYTTDLPFATLNLNAAFTKILEYKRSTLANSPLLSVKGVIGEQISQRGRATAGLTRGPLSGSVSANYTGSYLNTSPITLVTATGTAAAPLPVSRVPIWMTYDMNLSYRPETEDGWMSGSRVSLNIRNFTDKDPPIVLNGTNAVDQNAHNVFGRIISVELSKSF